jgi:glutamate 5-kinase
MNSTYKRVVVKVGTNVLTGEGGALDLQNIKDLVAQVADVKKNDIQIVLVSSGAVGAGRSMVHLSPDISKVVRRQVLAAVGQVKLMNIYADFFAEHSLFCAQVLATKEDFRDKVHYLNMKNCFLALLRDNIVPVVNENDVVSVGELMFTDNDELAGFIAAMLNADLLLILSSVDGVLDENKQVIPEIAANDTKILRVISPTRSSFGRGGMQTKFRIAQKAAKVGVPTRIANGRAENIIRKIVIEQQTEGTVFLPENHLSNTKKRIAYTENAEKGTIYINEGAALALLNKEKVSSLLPVGIEKIVGDFEKGDMLKIIQVPSGEVIGVGVAQYKSEVARTWIGQKGKKALVHCDYLYLE